MFETMHLGRALAACLFAFATHAYGAVAVLYSAADQPDADGKDLWLYTYLVSGEVGLNETVDVAFRYDIHSPLSVESQPAGWFAQTQPSDPALEADGHFTALNADGQVPASFGVLAERFLPGPLGPQAFEVFGENFDTLTEGATTPVPEPASWALLLGGAALLLGTVRRRG